MNLKGGERREAGGENEGAHGLQLLVSPQGRQSGLPAQLRKRLVTGSESARVRGVLRELRLSTVCQSARCPNRNECFSRGTATFMILGDVCTRGCRFCAVKKGVPRAVEPDEAMRVARAVAALRLRHVVITSVTRDDLGLGGAEVFRDCIEEVRRVAPEATIEVLTPDFGRADDALRVVLSGRPDVFNHNVETVPRLYPEVRPQADYERSLGVLRKAKEIFPRVFTKSGIMLGMGEERGEVLRVFDDLRSAGCDFLTIGQYLAPSRESYAVRRYVEIAEFVEYEVEARRRGFRFVASGVFVRSSYCADKALHGEGELRSLGVEGLTS
jgi:lipoic acid synthetase